MTGEGREGGYACPQTPRFWKTYLICGRRLQMLWTKKKYTVFLSVNVFSTKVLIGDTIFTSPNGDGTAILRGHPSHAKVSPLAVQRKYLHFSVIIRPWVMVRPRESNSRPPALQSNALPTELVLPRLLTDLNCVCAKVYEIRVFKRESIWKPCIIKKSVYSEHNGFCLYSR